MNCLKPNADYHDIVRSNSPYHTGASTGRVFTDLFLVCSSLQPTIDMLLNVAIFMWYGAVCPWRDFVTNDIISIYRLIPLGILILLLRRPPHIWIFHKKIPQIEGIRQATFMGFFGPIGCSAIFYLYVTVNFVKELKREGGDTPRQDVANLDEAVTIIVWFMVIVSVVRHPASTTRRYSRSLFFRLSMVSVYR